MVQTLVATNMRFPKEELKKYKELASMEGKSLSEFLRENLRLAIRLKILGKNVEVKKNPSIWNLKKYKKWASKVKDGARRHNYYLYGKQK